MISGFAGFAGDCAKRKLSLFAPSNNQFKLESITGIGDKTISYAVRIPQNIIEKDIMDIVINNCYGGFDISHSGIQQYAEKSNLDIQFRTMDCENQPFPSYEKMMELTLQPLDKLPLQRKEWNEFWFFLDSELWNADYIPRDDKVLISIVKKDSKLVSGDCARLKVVNIPDDIEWKIGEYDGKEWIAEVHRTWQ